MNARRCHWCCQRIAWDAPVVHPGFDYGDDAPLLCSDDCFDWWCRTFEAQQMRIGVAWSRLGAALLDAIAGPPCRLLARVLRRTDGAA